MFEVCTLSCSCYSASFVQPTHLLCVFLIHLWQSYIIDPDFLINYDIKASQKLKSGVEEADNQRKCMPSKRNTLMPYQKIEHEIRKDAQWPPITLEDEADEKAGEKQQLPEAIAEATALAHLAQQQQQKSSSSEEVFQTQTWRPENEILAKINELQAEVKKRQRFDDQNLETSF